MMICFPARGDDSEEQRKRLQQQSGALFRPLGTLHSPSSYQIVAGVITAEVPPCSLVRNTAPVHQHGRSGHLVCSTIFLISRLSLKYKLSKVNRKKKQTRSIVEKFTIPNQPGCLPGQRTPDVVCWCPPFINILCNCVDTGYNALPIWCCTLGREIETIVLGSGGRVGARKLC